MLLPEVIAWTTPPITVATPSVAIRALTRR